MRVDGVSLRGLGLLATWGWGRMKHLLLLIVLGLGTALPASAQAPPSGWIADARTGCRVWNPSPKPKETITWSGSCSNGLAQGRGVLQWFTDGKAMDRYDGEYRDGKVNGRGVYTSARGNRYDGEWRDGQQNGRGVYTWANGNRYDGEYRDNKPNGLGTYTLDGQVYSGTWTNGCFRQGDRWAWIGANKEECGFK